MWAYGSNGSLWVRTIVVICVTPKINTHFVTTIPTPEGDLPIRVSPFIKGSSHFVIMNERVI